MHAYTSVSHFLILLKLLSSIDHLDFVYYLLLNSHNPLWICISLYQFLKKIKNYPVIRCLYLIVFQRMFSNYLLKFCTVTDSIGWVVASWAAFCFARMLIAITMTIRSMILPASPNCFPALENVLFSPRVCRC